MTKQQLLKLKQRIDLILKKLTEEALEEGENISSVEFEEILLTAKTKLLEERGITLEEYSQMMAEINEEKKVVKKAREEKESELISKISMVKGEKGDSPVKGKDYFTKDEIEQIKNDVFSKIKIPAPQIINKIVKEIIREKPISKVIKTKEILRELDKTEIDKLQKDIIKLQESFGEIKIPEIKNWDKEIGDLRWRIDNINTRRASFLNRSDAGSFTTAIADSRYYKKSELLIIGDGIKKITVGTTEPTSPSVGDLWVDTT